MLGRLTDGSTFVAAIEMLGNNCDTVIILSCPGVSIDNLSVIIP